MCGRGEGSGRCAAGAGLDDADGNRGSAPAPTRRATDGRQAMKRSARWLAGLSLALFSGLASAHASSSSYLQLQVTRSEEHTSELQSLMRISYAVFCLKKKKQ